MFCRAGILTFGTVVDIAAPDLNYLKQVVHRNISCASRMNKAVVVFMKKQGFGYHVKKSSLCFNNEFIQVSLLAAPSILITESEVPLFIPNEALRKELKSFRRMASKWPVEEEIRDLENL